MTVKIRPYRNGGWEIDIMIRLDNGQHYRERRKAPVSSKSAALRWGEKRERYLLAHGPSTEADVPEPEPVKKEVPTFAEFAPRFFEGYVKANRFKPSTIVGIEKNMRVHVLPAFGDRRLDDLTQEDVQRFKGQRTHLSNKTVNHLPSLLRVMTTTAVDWGIIERRSTEFKRLKVANTTMDFYDFDEFEALVAAAAKCDPRTFVVILLGGEAGLRSGEIRGLEWSSIDWRRRMITIERSEWNGHVTLPKHDKIRQVPHDLAARSCAPRTPTPAGAARALQGSRRRAHAPDDPRLVDHRVSPGRHPLPVAALLASHVLFAPRHAGRASTGDPGTRRPRGSQNHAAIHAPDTGRARRRDPVARTTLAVVRRQRSGSWRRRGDGVTTWITIQMISMT